MRFQGLLYRALNPVYARHPLSGDGAKRFGGRFNCKGTPALYTSLSAETAIKEANQAGTLQPTTLVSYEADIAPVFDCTDFSLLETRSIEPVFLSSDNWREEMIDSGEARTQRFARELSADGFAGMLVPSFVKGARASNINLVLWRWDDSSVTTLRLIDDEDRLSRT